MGTLNVFEAARLMDVERVVYASSESVYGSPSAYGKASVNRNDYPMTRMESSLTYQTTPQLYSVNE
jgi:nucleoside-diphosphate-sugar epimerase